MCSTHAFNGKNRINQILLCTAGFKLQKSTTRRSIPILQYLVFLAFGKMNLETAEKLSMAFIVIFDFEVSSEQLRAGRAGRLVYCYMVSTASSNRRAQLISTYILPIRGCRLLVVAWLLLLIINISKDGCS